MPATRIAATGARARTMPAVVALLVLAGCSSVGSSSSAIPAASSPPEQTPSPEREVATPSPAPEAMHIPPDSRVPVELPSNSMRVNL